MSDMALIHAADRATIIMSSATVGDISFVLFILNHISYPLMRLVVH